MKNVKILWALLSLVTLIAVGLIICSDAAIAEDLQKAVCPKCGSEDTIPIIYGYPGPELCEATERGEVMLGG